MTHLAVSFLLENGELSWRVPQHTPPTHRGHAPKFFNFSLYIRVWIILMY